MNIQLTVDDKRLGSFDTDGALVRPALAIDGSPCVMTESSLLYILHEEVRYFVVVPMLFVEPFTVEIVAPKVIVKSKVVKVADDSQ